MPVGHLALVASRRVAVTSKATANGLLQLIKAGECLTDHSAEPIMINHVISMVRALMQIGGADNCAYIAIYQWKVDEEKLIPLVAGGCMWLCW